MSRLEVVVVIPTVQGREDHLDRCMAAYMRTLAGVRWQAVVEHNRATCGEAWNLGAEVARAAGATWLHMTADDLEPLDGWFEAAVSCVREFGASPSALIWTARAGEPDVIESHGDWAARYSVPNAVSMSRIPFCRTELWIDIPPIHYFSDNAFSSAMQAQGIPLVAVPGYAFRHHWAQAGRKQMNDEQWFREQTTWQQWAAGELLQRAPRWS